jgi:phosphate-selective porin OprO and OprP
MKNYLLLSGVALLALATPAFAQDDAAPQAYPENSGLDVPIDDTAPTQADTAAPTGDPVADRLNALEARIRQLEARNAQLEAHNSEVETRVQNVEVRAATAVQPGPAPTFSDVPGNFTFKPRGTFQIDYAAYGERKGGYDYNNGTDLRRARFGFDGTAFGKFKWRIEAEYVKQAVNLLDAYVQYPLTPKLTVTVGQHKAPYGLEANSTDALNTFLERGLASNAFGAVAAERRVGASLTYASDRINAQFGVFGSGEGIQRSSSTTPDEAFSFNGRFVWEPINDTDKLVHVGVSGYYATHLASNSVSLGDRPGSRVDGGQLVSASITGTNPPTGIQTGAKAAKYLGAETALVRGPFSLQGEYGKLWVDRFGTAPTVSFDGFYVFGSWFLTGESRTFKNGTVDRVKPFKDFEPGSGSGAIELVARYDQLDLTDTKLSPLARKGTTWTGGVNWYLNPNTRIIFNYIRFKGQNSPLYVLTTPVAGTGSRTAKGDVYQSRLQFDF